MHTRDNVVAVSMVVRDRSGNVMDGGVELPMTLSEIRELYDFYSSSSVIYITTSFRFCSCTTQPSKDGITEHPKMLSGIRRVTIHFSFSFLNGIS